MSKLVHMGIVVMIVISTMIMGPISSLQAKSEKKPVFEFGLVADSQYCDCDTKGTRHYRASLDKLDDAVKTLNNQDLVFTIQLGDLIDRNVSSFSDILPIYNQLEGPKYHVLGNHDFPVYSEEAVEILDMPNQYYDFSNQGWRFVVLDTNDLSFYANPEDSEKYKKAQEMYDNLKQSGAINAQTWNGGVGPKQMSWLRNVLKQAKLSGEKVLVFSHMPIYPKNIHNVWNDDELKQVLESTGNVVAYFNGHNHAGNYSKSNGIHYVSFQGMVETANTNAYSTIQLYPNKLEINGYDREQDRVLKINK